MATAATLLAQIDTAIEALLTSGAASYSIGSRSVTKHDLPSLFAERRLLQAEAARDSQGGMFSLGKMQRQT